jgi:transmembrane sensor
MSLLRFNYLLDQFKNDRLSSDEDEEFRALLRSGDYDSLVGEHFHKILMYDWKRTESADGNEDYLLETLHERLGIKAYQRRINISGMPFMAAAACLLLLAGFYLLRYRPARDLPALMENHQLAPGSPKAVLTLGNGSRIVLDSAANGAIAQQGATQVIKSSNGRLAYKVAAGNETSVYNNTLEVPRGGEYQLVLPDGSRVWLNAASSITYPNVFSGNNRIVQLTGEAYFEVARDASRPFIVSTGGMQVQVLGTAFNLMAYADEDVIEATLVKGAIRVIKGDQSKRISPGEQASLPNGKQEFDISDPDIEQVLAWKEGEFSFEGNDIKVIMRQIARWYDVQVVYQGDLSKVSLLGVISRKENANQLLEILEKTGKVHFNIDGRTITVMPSKPLK